MYEIPGTIHSTLCTTRTLLVPILVYPQQALHSVLYHTLLLIQTLLLCYRCTLLLCSRCTPQYPTLSVNIRSVCSLIFNPSGPYIYEHTVISVEWTGLRCLRLTHAARFPFTRPALKKGVLRLLGSISVGCRDFAAWFFNVDGLAEYHKR